MKTKKIEKHHILIALLVILLGALLYDDTGNKPKRHKNRPKKVYHLGEDKEIIRFGKNPMAIYSGGMRGGVTSTNPRKYPGDRMSTIYFDAQLKDDGTIWLVNSRYDPESYITCCYNNHLTVRFDASTYEQHGNGIKETYQRALNNGSTYGQRAGELYGLSRYILFIKDTNKRGGGDEFLVSMKDDTMPLRYLKTVSPLMVRESGGGGVYHYFMYNNWVQVKIHYRKYILKDWRRIETAMRQYIDKLYADAQEQPHSS